MVDYNSGPNAFVNSFLSTEIGVGIGQPSDYYAVHPYRPDSRRPSRSRELAKQPASVSNDASGNLLALGTTGKGVDAVISDFVAPATGTYYVGRLGNASNSVRPGRDPRLRLHPSW